MLDGSRRQVLVLKGDESSVRRFHSWRCPIILPWVRCDGQPAAIRDQSQHARLGLCERDRFHLDIVRVDGQAAGMSRKSQLAGQNLDRGCSEPESRTLQSSRYPFRAILQRRKGTTASGRDEVIRHRFRLTRLLEDDLCQCGDKVFRCGEGQRELCRVRIGGEMSFWTVFLTSRRPCIPSSCAI